MGTWNCETAYRQATIRRKLGFFGHVQLGDQNRNRTRKLLISRAPTKGKSQEPAYSQALRLIKTKSIGSRQRLRSCRESSRQTVRRLSWMVLAIETRRQVHG